jgi:hypothetical protein
MASTSAPLVQWSFKDLTPYWPYQQIPERPPPRIMGRGIFEGKDESGGWKFNYSEKVGEFWEYKIPPHYANALAAINAKIVWLQLFVAKKFKTTSVSQKEILGRMKNSCTRSLMFTADVRKMFLADVCDEFYSEEGDFVRSYTSKDIVFRSPALDSWLYVEYHKSTHSPPVYHEIAKASGNLEDPLKIELGGGATLPIAAAATDLISAWIVWRKLHNAEYFHIIVDKKRPWSLVDSSLSGKVPTIIMQTVVKEAFENGLPKGPSKAMVEQLYALQVILR